MDGIVFLSKILMYSITHISANIVW